MVGGHTPTTTPMLHTPVGSAEWEQPNAHKRVVTMATVKYTAKLAVRNTKESKKPTVTEI